MKMMRRWLLCFLSIVLSWETAVSFTAAGSAKASEPVQPAVMADNMDYNAGAALILDADITKENEELTSYAVELNGGEAMPVAVEEPEEEKETVKEN